MSTDRHSVSFWARLSSFVGNTMNMCSWILSQPIEFILPVPWLNRVHCYKVNSTRLSKGYLKSAFTSSELTEPTAFFELPNQSVLRNNLGWIFL